MSLDIMLFGEAAFKNLEAHLDRQTTRSELIAGNLANVETPGYRARDLDFSSVLIKATGRDDPEAMAATDPNHFGASDSVIETVEKTVDNQSGRVDGNTVDLDSEMGKLANVQLMYEAGLMALSKKLSLLSKAASPTA